MTDYPKIQRLFAELRNCAAIHIPEHFSLVMDIYPLLTKTEQDESANAFYGWAEKNAAQQPLKFCYAKFLLALDYFLADQHESSLHLVLETKKLFEEQNDSKGIGCCLSLMGGIYRTLGNYDLALKTLWEGYRLLEFSGTFSHFLMACSYNMGSIYFEMQNVEEAISLFKNTLEQSEKAQDRFWSNYALHGLGKVYMCQKKYAEAKELFLKAVSNAQQNKNPLTLSNSLTELANYEFHAGNFNEAEQLHKQALIIREENNFVGGAITNYIRLGEILIKDSKPDEALSVLEKGLQLAEQIKVKPKIYQIHWLLSEIYQRRDELGKSLFHYKLFHEIREQVEIEDSAKKIKNVQLVFEAEQTQKENIIIKKQKAEIEKKNCELQSTIDELTLSRVSRKARAVTLFIAIAMFVVEDAILHFALHLMSSDNYLLSLAVKMGIIFSLKPINSAVEYYLLKRVIKNKNAKREIYSPEADGGSAGSLTFLPLHTQAS